MNNYNINSGIYKITNLVTKKIYIGSSKFLNRRKSAHFRDLSLNKHLSTHLQRSFNKYGINNFQWEILETCEYNREQLLEREQYYLDTLLFAQEFINKENKKFLELGYNINPIAGSPSKRQVSEETKLKMSLSQLGRKASNETKKKLSLCKLGRKLSEETKNKMRKPISEEHKHKIKEGSKNRILPKDFGEKSLIGRKLNVIIDGVEYLTCNHAAKKLKISRATINRRVLSNKFPQCYRKYVKK